MGSQILERRAITTLGFRSAWYIDIWNNSSILFFLPQKWCFTKGNVHTSVLLPVHLLKDHAFIWVAALGKENWRSGIMMLYPTNEGNAWVSVIAQYISLIWFTNYINVFSNWLLYTESHEKISNSMILDIKINIFNNKINMYKNRHTAQTGAQVSLSILKLICVWVLFK